MRHRASYHESDALTHHKLEVSHALDAAALAIEEYYNGDRAWAERWLITALEANAKPDPMPQPQIKITIRGDCGQVHGSFEEWQDCMPCERVGWRSSFAKQATTKPRIRVKAVTK